MILARRGSCDNISVMVVDLESPFLTPVKEDEVQVGQPDSDEPPQAESSTSLRDGERWPSAPKHCPNYSFSAVRISSKREDVPVKVSCTSKRQDVPVKEMMYLQKTRCTFDCEAVPPKENMYLQKRRCISKREAVPPQEKLYFQKRGCTSKREAVPPKEKLFIQK